MLQIIFCAQGHLGDVVFVELPEPGTSVKQGAGFGSVESVKATSDVNSPVSGEVVEVNTKLTETPGLVNFHQQYKHPTSCFWLSLFTLTLLLWVSIMITLDDTVVTYYILNEPKCAKPRYKYIFILLTKVLKPTLECRWYISPKIVRTLIRQMLLLFFVFQINSSPHEDGWMIKVRPSSPSELDSLLGPKEYKKLCEEEDAH